MKGFLPEEKRAARIVSAQVGSSMAQVPLAWLRYRMAPVIP